MITSKQRAYLRGLANGIPPIFQVGKSGVTPNFVKQVYDALEARELIKITVLENSSEDVREICNSLTSSLGAEPVQVIGSKIVLYRQSRNKKQIELPSAR